MANETTVANLATLAPEIVEQGILPTAERLQVFAPVLQTPTAFREESGPGDTFRFEQADTLTFAALAVDGTDNANEAWVPTERSLAPVLLGTTLTIPLQGRMVAQGDPITYLQTEIGAAYATLNDSAATVSFAALYTEAPSSNPDHEIGANGTAFDHTLVRSAFQLLVTAGAPGPYNLFIDPIQWSEMYTDATTAALIKNSGSQPAAANATDGVRMDMYVGKLYGIDIWCVPTGLVESSGLHAMAVGKNALGMVWKNIATPLSPTASRINVDIDYHVPSRNFIVGITVCQDIGGIAFTSTTNKWLVDIIS